MITSRPNSKQTKVAHLSSKPKPRTEVKMGLFPFAMPDLPQIEYVKPEIAIVQKEARQNQREFFEEIDRVDAQFDIFKQQVPGWFNKFQDQLNKNYDVYYNKKLSQYKFVLVDNVDKRQK